MDIGKKAKDTPRQAASRVVLHPMRVDVSQSMSHRLITKVSLGNDQERGILPVLRKRLEGAQRGDGIEASSAKDNALGVKLWLPVEWRGKMSVTWSGGAGDFLLLESAPQTDRDRILPDGMFNIRNRLQQSEKPQIPLEE
jgi:hypothetical protein